MDSPTGYHHQLNRWFFFASSQRLLPPSIFLMIILMQECRNVGITNHNFYIIFSFDYFMPGGVTPFSIML